MRTHKASTPEEVTGVIRRRCPSILFEAIASGIPGGILDIGCGSGVILRAMDQLKRKVFGIDNSEAAIEICRGYAEKLSLQHTFRRCDIRAFDIPENHYAGIVAMSSLVAMRREELLDVLSSLRRGIKAGGVLFIIVFTTRDPIYSESDKYLPEGETTFFHQQWNSFMHFFYPGELRNRFSDFEILDYNEAYVTDYYPTRHVHHEARLCCRKPA